MDDPRDRSRNWLTFISLVKAIASEMPLTGALFALSILTILFGTIFGKDGVLVASLVVGLAAMISGMFVE